jgi:hypothetical protein
MQLRISAKGRLKGYSARSLNLSGLADVLHDPDALTVDYRAIYIGQKRGDTWKAFHEMLCLGTVLTTERPIAGYRVCPLVW